MLARRKRTFLPRYLSYSWQFLGVMSAVPRSMSSLLVEDVVCEPHVLAPWVKGLDPSLAGRLF